MSEHHVLDNYPGKYTVEEAQEELAAVERERDRYKTRLELVLDGRRLIEADRDKLRAELDAVFAERDSLRSRFTRKIVCLCGSTRFYRAFRDFNKRLTLEGIIVLTIGCEHHNDDELGITDKQKAELDELHKRKIDLADEILVLDVGGYIGSSTRSEIEYAEAKGKCVSYLSQEFPGYVEPIDPPETTCAAMREALELWQQSRDMPIGYDAAAIHHKARVLCRTALESSAGRDMLERVRYLERGLEILRQLYRDIAYPVPAIDAYLKGGESR